MVERMYFDEESRRSKPRKTHLDDDAYNKTTSVECIVASLMNVQVNAHHPEGDAPNACYPIKYGLKPERTLKLQMGTKVMMPVCNIFAASSSVWVKWCKHTWETLWWMQPLVRKLHRCYVLHGK